MNESYTEEKSSQCVPEAELSFLGAMFSGTNVEETRAAREAAAELATDEDFTFPAYRRIFQELKKADPAQGFGHLKTIKGIDQTALLQAATQGGGIEHLDFYADQMKAATAERDKHERIKRLLDQGGRYEDIMREEVQSLPDPEPEKREPFPTDCLGPKLAGIAEEFARAAMVPQSMAGASMLATIGAGLGAGLMFKTHIDKDCKANLYNIIAAKSGTGKDNLQNLISAPITAKHRELVDEWETKGRGEVEGKLDAVEQKLKDARKEGDEAEMERKLIDLNQQKKTLVKKIEGRPGIIVNDTTAEALAVRMGGQPGQAIFSESSEARSVISLVKGRYTKGNCSDVAFYAGGYSGTPVEVDRMGRTLSLPSPCISCNWLMQPDALNDALGDAELVESGFFPRFQMHDPEAEPQQIEEDMRGAGAATVTEWGNLIDSLLKYREKGDKPESVTLSAEGKKLLLDYDNQLRARRCAGGDLSGVYAFVGRWAENACKISLVLHAGHYGDKSHENEIDAFTVENAIDISKWFAQEQLALIRKAGRTKQDAELSRLIGVLIDKGGSATLKYLSNNRGITKEMVKRLVAANPNKLTMPTPKSSPKGGRPSATVELKKS